MNITFACEAASLIVLFEICCMLQLRHRSGSFIFFRNHFSGCEGYVIFLLEEKGNNGVGGGGREVAQDH